ncbi:hypothetical protein [Nonomuraea sp. NPDC005650]|uniref:hypothetical protein n=1 Tax=Nonomuraea sp. NPDC005650 TaxID=3157045 RepID=UPI0033B2DBFC
MLPFVQPSAGATVLLWLTVVAGLGGSFFLWQHRYALSGRLPLVHPALTRSLQFAAGVLTAMGYFGSGLASTLVLAMFLQEGLRLSALAAAAVTLPAALSMTLASALSWRVSRRFGDWTVPAGLALSAVSMLASGLVGLLAPQAYLPVLLALCAMCMSAAGGLVIAPLQASTLQHAPPEAAGVAVSLLHLRTHHKGV